MELVIRFSRFALGSTRSSFRSFMSFENVWLRKVHGSILDDSNIWAARDSRRSRDKSSID